MYETQQINVAASRYYLALLYYELICAATENHENRMTPCKLRLGSHYLVSYKDMLR